MEQVNLVNNPCMVTYHTIPPTYPEHVIFYNNIIHDDFFLVYIVGRTHRVQNVEDDYKISRRNLR
jgi:hypothetical protein